MPYEEKDHPAPPALSKGAGGIRGGADPGHLARPHHPGRFAHPEEERQPPERQEDTGIWTPEG